jgi:hypothetical protein
MHGIGADQMDRFDVLSFKDILIRRFLPAVESNWTFLLFIMTSPTAPDQAPAPIRANLTALLSVTDNPPFMPLSSKCHVSVSWFKGSMYKDLLDWLV